MSARLVLGKTSHLLKIFTAMLVILVMFAVLDQSAVSFAASCVNGKCY
jgi:hypothetical protein